MLVQLQLFWSGLDLILQLDGHNEDVHNPDFILLQSVANCSILFGFENKKYVTIITIIIIKIKFILHIMLY